MLVYPNVIVNLLAFVHHFWKNQKQSIVKSSCQCNWTIASAAQYLTLCHFTMNFKYKIPKSTGSASFYLIFWYYLLGMIISCLSRGKRAKIYLIWLMRHKPASNMKIICYDIHQGKKHSNTLCFVCVAASPSSNLQSFINYFSLLYTDCRKLPTVH